MVRLLPCGDEGVDGVNRDAVRKGAWDRRKDDREKERRK